MSVPTPKFDTKHTKERQNLKQKKLNLDGHGCPICLDFKQSMKMITTCTHSLCADCAPKCSECPTCREPFKPEVLVDNLGLSQIHQLIGDLNGLELIQGYKIQQAETKRLTEELAQAQQCIVYQQLEIQTGKARAIATEKSFMADLKTQRDLAIQAGTEFELARQQFAAKERETLPRIEALNQEINRLTQHELELSKKHSRDLDVLKLKEQTLIEQHNRQLAKAVKEAREPAKELAQQLEGAQQQLKDLQTQFDVKVKADAASRQLRKDENAKLKIEKIKLEMELSSFQAKLKSMEIIKRTLEDKIKELEKENLRLMEQAVSSRSIIESLESQLVVSSKTLKKIEEVHIVDKNIQLAIFNNEKMIVNNTAATTGTGSTATIPVATVASQKNRIEENIIKNMVFYDLTQGVILKLKPEYGFNKNLYMSFFTIQFSFISSNQKDLHLDMEYEHVSHTLILQIRQNIPNLNNSQRVPGLTRWQSATQDEREKILSTMQHCIVTADGALMPANIEQVNLGIRQQYYKSKNFSGKIKSIIEGALGNKDSKEVSATLDHVKLKELLNFMKENSKPKLEMLFKETNFLSYVKTLNASKELSYILKEELSSLILDVTRACPPKLEPSISQAMAFIMESDCLLSTESAELFVDYSIFFSKPYIKNTESMFHPVKQDTQFWKLVDSYEKAQAKILEKLSTEQLLALQALIVAPDLEAEGKGRAVSPSQLPPMLFNRSNNEQANQKEFLENQATFLLPENTATAAASSESAAAVSEPASNAKKKNKTKK